jgi:hypothetical protein
MSFVFSCVGCSSKLRKKNYWSKERSLHPCNNSFLGSSTYKLHRWRKYTLKAQRMVDEFTNDVHELDDKEMKYSLSKFWEHGKFQNVSPDFL